MFIVLVIYKFFIEGVLVLLDMFVGLLIIIVIGYDWNDYFVWMINFVFMV